MSFLHNLFAKFFYKFWAIIISLFIVYVLYKFFRFYRKVWTLPPGPIPLPLIGNLLVIRRSCHWTETIKILTQKYGPVITFWMGNRPFVFIADLKIAKEAFRKVKFSGRPESFTMKMVLKNDQKELASMDYGPTYEALRNVTLTAVQKYWKNEQIIYYLNDSVEKTVKKILDVEGVDTLFCPNEYIQNMIFNSIFSITFGKNYTSEDLSRMKVMVTEFSRDLSSRMILWEFSSLIALLDRKMVNIYKEKMKDCIKCIIDLYKNHEKDYDESNERCICDAVITAKNTALRDGKVLSSHLTDDNLSLCMFDILFAATDSTAITFVWALLFMTYYPEFQQKLRKEIESQIGDRIATHEDRYRCDFTMAFLKETLRIRNVIPVGLFHKTLVDTKLANHSITKDTIVVTFNQMISTDEKYWPNGHQFTPERFLDNGKYMSKEFEANIPFGVGRRICLGEKLAQINLFLAFVRFIQLTKDYELVARTDSGIEVDPNQTFFLKPKKFKLIFKTRF